MTSEEKCDSIENYLRVRRLGLEDADLAPGAKWSLEASFSLIQSLSGPQRDAMLDFIQHFPLNESDTLSLVIKGHCLIERHLGAFIESAVPNPSAFDLERMNAAAKTNLAAALCAPTPESEKLWAVIRKLNALRNKFAHRFREGGPEGTKHFLDKFLHETQATLGMQGALIEVLTDLYARLVGTFAVQEAGSETGQHP